MVTKGLDKKPADECYLEGAQAAQKGKPVSDNPYEEGSEDYLSWADGWNSVQSVTDGGRGRQE